MARAVTVWLAEIVALAARVPLPDAAGVAVAFAETEPVIVASAATVATAVLVRVSVQIGRA